MAYLRPLIGCTCNRPATVELLNRRNSSYGKFCNACGALALKRLQQRETEEDERAAS